MKILPSLLSDRRKRTYNIEDFPAPVRPTTPTFIPAYALKLKFLIDGSIDSLYFIVTSSKITSPKLGQAFP